MNRTQGPWPVPPTLPYVPFIPNTEAWFEITRIPPAYASQAWVGANTAVATPVYIPDHRTVKQLYIFNGATVSGNFDIGLYGAIPQSVVAAAEDYPAPIHPGSLLTSSGATAQAGTSQWQEVNVADVEVGPGWYFLAAAFNNTTATVMRLGGASGISPKVWHFELARVPLNIGGGFPLPADGSGYGVFPLGYVIPCLALGSVA